MQSFRDIRFLLSIIFAFSLWFYSNFYSADFVRVFKVPLFLQHASSNYVILSKTALEATISVKGPQIFLKNFEENFKQVNIQLNFGPGTHKLFLDSKTLELPKNLKLLSVEPRSFDIIVDELDERQVVVKLDLRENPPTYVQVKQINFPDRITLIGARSYLFDTSEVRTASIDLSSIEFNPYLRRKTIKAPLVVPEGLRVKGSSIIPVAIEYEVITETIEYPRVRVETPDGYIAKPEFIKARLVTLKGVDFGNVKFFAQRIDSAQSKAVVQTQAGFGVISSTVEPVFVELIPEVPVK